MMPLLQRAHLVPLELQPIASIRGTCGGLSNRFVRNEGCPEVPDRVEAVWWTIGGVESGKEEEARVLVDVYTEGFCNSVLYILKRTGRREIAGEDSVQYELLPRPDRGFPLKIP